jgi:hypothetical protein
MLSDSTHWILILNQNQIPRWLNGALDMTVINNAQVHLTLKLCSSQKLLLWCLKTFNLPKPKIYCKWKKKTQCQLSFTFSHLCEISFFFRQRKAKKLSVQGFSTNQGAATLALALGAISSPS